MQEVLADIERWLAAGHTTIGLATVVETWGSAPRRPGAKMAFTLDGQISGSVSGGCVEAVVIAEGQDVLRSNQPRLLEFGVADETAWDVGLACGGRLAVFVETLDLAAYIYAREHLAARTRGATATIIKGPEAILGLKAYWQGEANALKGLTPDEIAILTGSLAESRMPRTVDLTADAVAFVDVLRPPPVLIMVGGAHIAVALVSLAKTVGYRTVVVDPRRVFGSGERFSHADRLVQLWPAKGLADAGIDQDTAVVTLSHDPKIDDPALEAALASDAFYVGALGSRATHAARRDRLRRRGVTDQQLARLRAPVGLDIGAENPEEIALAIMAEIVAAYRAGAG